MFRLLVPVLICCGMMLPAASKPPMVRMTAETEAERQARERIEDFEARLEEIQALPFAERTTRSRSLGGDLERLVKRVDGSRFANKARYLLAEWRLQFAPDDPIEPLLEANLRSEHLHYKNLTHLLLARWRLEQGRVPEARRAAERVVDRIPEFSPIMALIGFHEQAGQPAPHLDAKNLAGGSTDPLASASEPWLVYCFLRTSDPAHHHWVAELLQELAGDEDYQGVVRLVLVSFDQDPLATMRRVNQLPGGRETDLLWVNPADTIVAERWQSRWSLPNLPCGAIIGPDRTRYSHLITTNQLRTLIGKDPVEQTRPDQGSGSHGHRGGPKGGFGWKGR